MKQSIKQTNKQFVMMLVSRSMMRKKEIQPFQASVSSQLQGSTHKSDFYRKMWIQLQSWICCPDGTPCARSRDWWAWCTPRRRRAGWCRSTAESTPFGGERRSEMTNTGWKNSLWDYFQELCLFQIPQGLLHLDDWTLLVLDSLQLCRFFLHILAWLRCCLVPFLFFLIMALYL